MAVTILRFQGRMREEVVYGVCLPVTGFSALFVLFSLMTVVSVIVAGFVYYHRQLAKVAEEAAPEPTNRNAAAAANAAAVAAAAAVAVQQQQEGYVLTSAREWGFNTWFRKKQNDRPVLF